MPDAAAVGLAGTYSGLLPVRKCLSYSVLAFVQGSVKFDLLHTESSFKKSRNVKFQGADWDSAFLGNAFGNTELLSEKQGQE